MFNINKEELLTLNDTMRETIKGLDFDNPQEVSAFACSMVSIGNQINMAVVKKACQKK